MIRGIIGYLSANCQVLRAAHAIGPSRTLLELAYARHDVFASAEPAIVQAVAPPHLSALCAMPCSSMLCCAVLCCAALRCAALCCAVLCCAVLSCPALSCPVLC